MVVMGVSGSGKTTVAQALSSRLGWPFAEGDDFHPPANIEKMRSGRPLDDADRQPWLQAVADWVGAQERHGLSAVITCSALKRGYRDRLRAGHPSIWFAHVTASAETIADRLSSRRGHYMPPSLLASQLSTLEPLGEDEPGASVDDSGSVDDAVITLVTRLRAERPLVPRPAS